MAETDRCMPCGSICKANDDFSGFDVGRTVLRLFLDFFFDPFLGRVCSSRSRPSSTGASGPCGVRRGDGTAPSCRPAAVRPVGPHHGREPCVAAARYCALRHPGKNRETERIRWVGLHAQVLCRETHWKSFPVFPPPRKGERHNHHHAFRMVVL